MHKNNDYQNLGDKLLKEISVDGISTEELFWKLACIYSDDEAHAKRMYSYFNKKYFCCSTPINANIPINGKPFRGLPISCFLTEVEDTADMRRVYEETMFLSSMGGGIGAYYNKNFQSMYDDCNNQNKVVRNVYGVIPFLTTQGRLTRLLGGYARKIGSLAAYLHISHADIEYFLDMRKNIQGIDPEYSVPRYIHHAVVIPDEFMEQVKKDGMWDLYNSGGLIVKSVKARELFTKLLKNRTETGEPYILFEDNTNKALAPHHKNLGLKIKTSNLCTEITLITGKDHHNRHRTAVCCLGSINLYKYDDWKKEEHFFNDIARFYDNILTYFIVEGVNRNLGDIINYEHEYGLCTYLRQFEKESIEKAFNNNHPLRAAVYSSYMSRDIGIGVCGFDTLLKSKNIAFESSSANLLNDEIFALINKNLKKASIQLAEERGACPDAQEGGAFVRFSYFGAIAPTSIISYMMSVSKCIEPEEPVFISKNQAGFYLMKDPILARILYEKGLDSHENWMKIANGDGLELLGQELYDVFKGPFEINPMKFIQLAGERTQYIDQSQSLNLYLKSPINLKTLTKIHLDAWQYNIKTLYYLRSTSVLNASASLDIKESHNNVIMENFGSKNTTKEKVIEKEDNFVCNDTICTSCQ
jgi:ribonucleoside-diphosphate reductase alpha chain